MYSTIKDLWYGNIAPCDHCGSDDPELSHLVGLMERNREEPAQNATPKQIEIFEKYIDCSDEYYLKMMERAFCDGFCLATRFLSESLAGAQ